MNVYDYLRFILICFSFFPRAGSCKGVSSRGELAHEEPAQHELVSLNQVRWASPRHNTGTRQVEPYSDGASTQYFKPLVPKSFKNMDFVTTQTANIGYCYPLGCSMFRNRSQEAL